MSDYERIKEQLQEELQIRKRVEKELWMLKTSIKPVREHLMEPILKEIKNHCNNCDLCCIDGCNISNCIVYRIRSLINGNG